MRIAHGLILAWLVLLLAAACANGDPITPEATTTVLPARPTRTVAPSPEPPEVPAGPASDVLAIVNGTLIDGTGAEPLADAYVVVHGDRIAEVGRADPQIPPDAIMVDARGGSILPGLVDAHVHVVAQGPWSDGAFVPWIQAGITTLRDVGTVPLMFPSILQFALAQEYDHKAPRIAWCGPIITSVGGYPTTVRDYAPVAQEVASAEEAVRLVNQLAEDGARVIKLGLERGYRSDEGWPLLSLAEVTAISEAAHQRGLLVSAHVTSLDEVRLALDGGVDDLAHAPLEPLSAELIQEMLQRGVTMATTATIWGPESRVAAANTKRYLDAGGTVALATDFGCCNQTAGIQGMLWEMEFLSQDAGFTAMDLIVSATRNGAIVSNLGGEIGTIEPGKIADIIVVEGDPLVDIWALADTSVVIQAGQIVRGGR